MAKEEKAKIPEILQLGNRITELRKKAGYKNYEYFAYENEIARSLYFRFENGQDMRFSSIIKIIKAHNMTLSEFFGEGFDEPKK